ncbi:peptide deformylase, mitochondrial [Scaptodrosophila lebanonensis]|uniref:Peptide deformylase n=1 Tax=Drosophila lebanonensis TaxID=7225 RepID=A0A6J2TCW1_DROLE|nr:peptide deformylase, mitochondrial [Scaptodrosophila lebanonensis]
MSVHIFNSWLTNFVRLYTALKKRWFHAGLRPISATTPITTPPYEHFTQIGDPVLRGRAAEVPADKIDSEEINGIIERMVKVLRHYDCVGVAAPQIGIPLRIIVMEFAERKRQQFTAETYAARKMSTLPLTVFINPELEIISEVKHKQPEGCMSVRGYAAEVARYDRVKVSGVGKLGTSSEIVLEGWSARIAQHEVDHLNGVIYIDRMDSSSFCCLSWQQVNAAGGHASIVFDK